MSQSPGAAWRGLRPVALNLGLPLLAANLLAWAWAYDAFRGRPALLGTAFLAWVFGLRHAVDPDHIAAIDNVVRKLLQQRRDASAVGFYFSLGHSTIVFAASVVIAASAAAAIQTRLGHIIEIGSTVGVLVSAGFLLVVGLANLGILVSVWRSFCAVRRGAELHEGQLDALLSGRGPLARIFRPLFRSVSSAWHMYPIGFLFGLGFDTASEIGLLGISATQAGNGMSPWQTLVFPALFTAGMALVDTADSALMVRAYGWAFLNPLRKLWFNLTITAASVVVALLIGCMEVLGLLVDRFGLVGGMWDTVSALNERMEALGFVVVGVFACSWLLSMAIYRWKQYDRLVVAPLPGNESRG